jgi:hypothetical protein
MPNRYVPILQEHAPSSLFDLDRLIDERGVLSVHLLHESGHRLSLTFEGYLAYRKRDEGNAMRTLSDASGSGGLGKSFYRVEDSSFLEWFEADGYGLHRAEGLVHVVVMTIDDVIDIICQKVPLIAMSGGR